MLGQSSSTVLNEFYVNSAFQSVWLVGVGDNVDSLSVNYGQYFYVLQDLLSSRNASNNQNQDH